MLIKTLFISFILIFLLQQIYNFIYENYVIVEDINKNIKKSVVEKYKLIAEEAFNLKNNENRDNDINMEKIYDITQINKKKVEEINENVEEINENEMENYLLNLVINS